VRRLLGDLLRQFEFSEIEQARCRSAQFLRCARQIARLRFGKRACLQFERRHLFDPGSSRADHMLMQPGQ
jgi:hypothetical protein